MTKQASTEHTSQIPNSYDGILNVEVKASRGTVELLASFARTLEQPTRFGLMGSAIVLVTYLIDGPEALRLPFGVGGLLVVLAAIWLARTKEIDERKKTGPPQLPGATGGQDHLGQPP